MRDQNDFEFTKPLEEIIPQFQQIAKSVYPALYNMTSNIEDAIDRKVEEADVISDFVNGSQYNIFKRIETTKKGNQANFAYVTPNLIQVLDEIYASRTPWDQMTRAKDTLDTIYNEISDRQKEEREKAIRNIESKLDAIKALSAFSTLTPTQQSQVDTMFTVLMTNVENERYIGNLIAMSGNITEAYERCIRSINEWVETAEAERKRQEDKESNLADKPHRPVKTYVNKSSAMNVDFSKNILETTDDVEAFIEALKTRLMGFIKQNKNSLPSRHVQNLSRLLGLRFNMYSTLIPLSYEVMNGRLRNYESRFKPRRRR